MYCKLEIDGKLVYIKKGTPNGDEVLITESEYFTLATNIKRHTAELERYMTLVLDGNMNIEDVPEEYVEEILTAQMQIIVANYADAIVKGSKSIEDVPTEYKEIVAEAVEFIKNIPEPNKYGIPFDLLLQIKDDTVTEIEEAVINGTD